MARDHRDGLRGFARCQHHPRRRGNTAGCVGARTFGNCPQLIGADLGSLQFQLPAGRFGDQPVSATLVDSLQAQRIENQLEALVDRETAVQARTLNAGSEGRVRTNHHARLLAEGTEYAVQAARRNVEGVALRVLTGGGSAGGAGELTGGGDGEAKESGAQGTGKRGKATVHKDCP